MQNISFKQYKCIDLSILAVLLAISEAVTTVATNKWFVGVPFAISTTLLLTLVAMMRWSGYAAIIAALGGVVFSLASGADASQYLIYTVGNLFSLLGLFVLLPVGKERVRRSAPWTLLYCAVSYASLQLGRWLVSLIFEPSIGSLLVFLTTDIITLLFSAVVLLLMRRVDGVFEDQKHYLLRLAEEREKGKPEDFGTGGAYYGEAFDGDECTDVNEDEYTDYDDEGEYIEKEPYVDD